MHVGEIHHECEIVVRLKFGGYGMSLTDSARAVDAVTVGLDMTLRELQMKLKKEGHPWTLAKVFPSSAIIGPWHHVSGIEEIEGKVFSLSVNGKRRQSGDTSEMLFSISEAIAYASTFFPLCEGDLVFTGTPKGVGPVFVGDKADLNFDTIQYSVQWL